MSDSHQDIDPSASDPGPARFFTRRTFRSPKEALHPEAAPPPPPPKPPSQRRPGLSAFSGFLSFLLLVALGGLVAFAAMQRSLVAPGPLAADRTVFIAPRTEVVDIIDQLNKAGVIDQPTMLKGALWLEGRWSNVKAGEYMFKRRASLRDVIDALVSGRQLLHSVTIPEGLTSEQIVERLRESDVLAGEIREIPREGSLLPETYRVPRGMLRANLIRKMQLDHNRLVDEIWERRAPDLPISSKYEMVTLASIVEKETGRADERTRVAAVFLNRLNKRMRLQSDPTIVYGIVGGKGSLGRPIQRSEITAPTAYNTYTISGLPPGPIANPGRAALEAVANPSRTKDLYFVADGTGGHVFSETLEQHNRNVSRWREIEKEAKEGAVTNAVDRTEPDAEPPAKPPLPPRRAPGRRGDLRFHHPVFGGLEPALRSVNTASAHAVPGSLATRGPIGAAPLPLERRALARSARADRAISRQSPIAVADAPLPSAAFAFAAFGAISILSASAGAREAPIVAAGDDADAAMTDVGMTDVGMTDAGMTDAAQDGRAAKFMAVAYSTPASVLDRSETVSLDALLRSKSDVDPTRLLPALR